MAGLGHNNNGFGCQLLFSSGELNRFYRCRPFFQTKTSCMSTDCEFVVQDIITALNNGTKKKKKRLVKNDFENSLLKIMRVTYHNLFFST